MEPFDYRDHAGFADSDERQVLHDTQRPIIFGMLRDPREAKIELPEDAIYERLIDDIFDPDPLRSHVITLHLYVEYWLDRILTVLKVTNANRMTFSKKTTHLKERGVLDADLFNNIVAINRLRNVYAHELDLRKADKIVADNLLTLKIDPYFESTDTDHFRSICVQTMMLLEATLANGCKPPRLQRFPHEEAKNKLLAAGELFWQECELISKVEYGNITTYQLRCPLCLEGTLEREKDNTPGFRDSAMRSCGVCGLSGDGSTLKLDTASLQFRSRGGAGDINSD